jgi:putative ABC transport system permease protein
MKYLPLVWKNIWRKKIRTIFALAVIFIAFVLFGFLMTIRTAFALGVEIAGQDRLVLINKISLIQPLPISYQRQLETVPGVESVAHASWFGGTYQNRPNAFAQMAIVPQQYFGLYPEAFLPEDQMRAWQADRQGAVAGIDLARRYGWKIGDRIPIQGTIFRPKSGAGNAWEFNLVGIYDSKAPGFDKSTFFFRYDYFDENREFGQGIVGWYVVKIADPSQSNELAHRFDEMFANSQFETKTTTEKGFIESFAKQIGDVGFIMIAILFVVFFTMLLAVMIVMIYSVRERTNELGVLKTLGFSNGTVLTLVLAESLFMAILAGGLGLGLAWLAIQGGDPTNGGMPTWVLLRRDVLIGIGLMIVLGVLAGALPATQAMRLRISDALRRA